MSHPGHVTYRRAKVLLLLLSLVLAGCGSSASVAYAGSPGSPGGGAPASTIVFGRALLDRPASGATAELTDLSGNSLGYPQARVDETGNFRIPAPSLPPEFRVKVVVPTDSGWNLPVIANVRNYTNQQAVFPNILTTAAALYRERHGVSQEEAVARLKAIFNIPAAVDIGYGVDESRRSYFRHSQFLQRAAENGGVAAYLSTLIQAGPTANQSIEASDSANFAGQVGDSIIANIGADIIVDAVDQLFGLLAQALGLNTSGITEAEEIQLSGEDLTEIQASLAQLNIAVADDFNKLSRLTSAEGDFEAYLTLTDALNPVLVEISVQTANLALVASTVSVTNTPTVLSQGVQNLLADLSEVDAQADLEQIATTLLGRNQSVGLLQVYQRLLTFSAGAFPITSTGGPLVWANTPALSNARIFDPFERFIEFWVPQQTLALNLVAENANASLNPSNVEDARRAAIDYQKAVAQQLQYLRFPQQSDLYLSLPQVSDGSTVSKVFYTQIQAPVPAYRITSDVKDPEDEQYQTITTDGGATLLAMTSSFQAPGAPSGWNLPTLQELQQLRALCLQSNPTDAVAGLTSLGFTFPQNNPEPMLWCQYDFAVYGEYNEITVDDTADYVAVFDFATGEITGTTPQEFIPNIGTYYPYLEVRTQTSDSSQTFRDILATGLRPTTAPALSLSADGSRVTATLNGENISEACVWTSSNPQQLEVRGLGDDVGLLTWHPGGTLVAQTVTATLPGMNAATGAATTLQATLQVPVPNPAPSKTLVGILLSPGNSVLLDSSNATVFKAVGYYQDNTVADLSNQVVWSLERPDGTPYPANKATINGNFPGILLFTGPILNDSTVVVKATLGAVVGQTQLKVATPF